MRIVTVLAGSNQIWCQWANYIEREKKNTYVYPFAFLYLFRTNKVLTKVVKLDHLIQPVRQVYANFFQNDLSTNKLVLDLI